MIIYKAKLFDSLKDNFALNILEGECMVEAFPRFVGHDLWSCLHAAQDPRAINFRLSIRIWV